MFMALAPESWPAPFQRLIRASNKHLLNPLMLRLAGRRYFYASVIEHTGRRSGISYRTPIVADRVGDGFVVPLPYGTDVDWVRNILAAKRATVIHKGQTYQFRAPEIIAATQALPLLPPARRRTFERVSIEHFLRVRGAH